MSSKSLAEIEAALPISTLPIFVVGAGGIGCELLKNLVLMGFRNIEVIDLDTIDSSNLNRQFLFSEDHVGKSKASTAAGVLQSWCPDLHVVAHHGNVKSQDFDVDFYQRFKIVLNGLDNVSARKHVNRMCMQAGIPLVESGTMGYNGQVQPISKGKCACFDCEPKAADTKTFAVCTIHARPTTMVHCVHYAKEFYARVVGDNLAGAASSDAQQGEMTFLDSSIGALEGLGGNNDETPTSAGTESKRVEILGSILKALFQDTIEETLRLKPADTWTITPPMPLPMSSLLPRRFSSLGAHEEALGDDVVPSLEQMVEQFIQSGLLCTQRGRKAFDKDDAMSVGLVAATANLRATVFHITVESTFDLRTIAGSIVPAIASTNAVIASCVVAQALQLLNPIEADSDASGASSSYVTLRAAPISRKRPVQLPTGKTVKVKDRYLLYSSAPNPPNPKCYICSGSKVSMAITLNARSHTLRSFVDLILKNHQSFVCPTIFDRNNNENTIFEEDEFEGLAKEPLTRWISVGEETGGSTSARWTLGDLHQDLEWSVEIFHRPDLHENETEFEVHCDAPPPAVVASSVAANGSEIETTTTTVDDDDEVVEAYHPAKKRQKVEGVQHKQGGGGSHTEIELE